VGHPVVEDCSVPVIFRLWSIIPDNFNLAIYSVNIGGVLLLGAPYLGWFAPLLFSE